MKANEINTYAKKAWLGMFIILIVLINAFIAYHRMTDKSIKPLNPNIVNK